MVNKYITGAQQAAQADARSRAGSEWFKVSTRAPLSLSLGREWVDSDCMAILPDYLRGNATDAHTRRMR